MPYSRGGVLVHLSPSERAQLDRRAWSDRQSSVAHGHLATGRVTVVLARPSARVPLTRRLEGVRKPVVNAVRLGACQFCHRATAVLGSACRVTGRELPESRRPRAASGEIGSTAANAVRALRGFRDQIRHRPDQRAQLERLLQERVNPEVARRHIGGVRRNSEHGNGVRP